MEDLSNQTKNPFEKERDISDYALRDGSAFSNFEHIVNPIDIDRYKKIVLAQAAEQSIYWISVYLETHNTNATSQFSHGLVYMADIIKEGYPEVYDLLMEINQSVGYVGTEKELNYEDILQKLIKIKEELKLSDKDYFDFAEEKGVSKEKLLTECISRIIPRMIPIFNTPEKILKLKEEWDLSKNKSFEEFVEKSRELLDAIIKDKEFWRFSPDYFSLIQALGERI